MIDDRRGAILQAVVAQYIETSQPVSSASVVATAGIDASSATVRSEMAALEREGFLQQPHTSAGRIPTDLGYRHFVDRLSVLPTEGTATTLKVEEFFAGASGTLENLYVETSKLLSRLTGVASLVVDSGLSPSRVHGVELVPLADHRLVLVVVFADGDVERQVLTTHEAMSREDCDVVARLLSHHLSGKRLPLGDSLAAALAVQSDNTLFLQCLQLLRQKRPANDHVYVGGTAQLASAFDAIETVQGILSILEHQIAVVALIRSLLGDGVAVSIGRELESQPLSTCALVVAPTVVDGVCIGSVALLGPTRMNYRRALSAVRAVSKELGEWRNDS